jgi:hypothetical protein
MPDGAKILGVDSQGDYPCIWALVDTEKELKPQQFRIVGTGHPIPEPIYLKWYIGSFKIYNGAFVGHVFDEI